MISSVEIERKYKLGSLPAADRLGAGVELRQGYLVGGACELRLRAAAQRYLLTVKESGDLSRSEWEAEIPRWAFEGLWPSTLGARIEKTRFAVTDEGRTLEFDQYHGQHEGLVILECEFESEESASTFTPPAEVQFIG